MWNNSLTRDQVQTATDFFAAVSRAVAHGLWRRRFESRFNRQTSGKRHSLLIQTCTDGENEFLGNHETTKALKFDLIAPGCFEKYHSIFIDAQTEHILVFEWISCIRNLAAVPVMESTLLVQLLAHSYPNTWIVCNFKKHSNRITKYSWSRLWCMALLTWVWFLSSWLCFSPLHTHVSQN